MFSVVAKKSTTFSSLLCLSSEEVCGSWEGAQPGSQPKLASGNIAYHGCHAQFMNGGVLGGCKTSLSSWSLVFFCWEFCKIHEIWIPWSPLGDWLRNWLSDVEKNILWCMVCFAYSLLVVILVFSSVLFNSLYLSLQVLPFVHSTLHVTGGEWEGW